MSTIGIPKIEYKKMTLSDYFNFINRGFMQNQITTIDFSDEFRECRGCYANASRKIVRLILDFENSQEFVFVK